MIKKIEEDPILERSILLVFNFFERSRISIENNRIDVNIFKPLMKDIAIDMLTRFKPWIDKQSPNYIADLEKFRKLMES